MSASRRGGEDVFEQALAGRISARAAAASVDGLRQFAAAWRDGPAEYAAGGTPTLRSKGLPADTRIIALGATIAR